ncbi:MAG TPA: helix-turn-helix domain-containing protein [Methanoregulaceae archaeon]|nr:helix-turn-helix domain-containing protein [Methanoregulaceae archaeon]
MGENASWCTPVTSMKEREQGLDRRVREFVSLSPDGRIWGEIITEPLLTVAQVAATLQIREKLVRNHIKEKRLKAVKIGKYWRIKPEDLHAFIEANSSIRTEPHSLISNVSEIDAGIPGSDA